MTNNPRSSDGRFTFPNENNLIRRIVAGKGQRRLAVSTPEPVPTELNELLRMLASSSAAQGSSTAAAAFGRALTPKEGNTNA